MQALFRSSKSDKQATPVAYRLAILLALILFVGCRGRSDGRYEVQGSVTWNGEPLETGSITFFPITDAAPEAGKIVEGKFSFRCPPGTCRVEIRAERFAGMIESMNQPRIEQYIPGKYNASSTLTALVSDYGDNSYTFELVASE